ncbi:MBL fold metallo-hydrolase [Agrobacterium vitis]|uniref:MBL fold metallo-hydrolase n=1 Tax=Agrobacterium vitis TaxID=373 RepID=A0A109CLW5_AGRVI|nr:MBL fold metallo-hydrolase [Agrobacterium vitis]KAA3509823.1 MBL fold metallo-hydrolase [Agrobacterium vitis]KAA3523445.1 MBL fold metallo-hydrolase [Agrobacterium vitis]MCF1479024.1 MBL fold metallo-hydrolase [Agrobacterium vitis]MUO80315.1 MBL fold metallo-hydrolase [Agrobacterium vitis]MUO94885.1 MBL fold metallo-hydrolase [Agrobacterium vitis]
MITRRETFKLAAAAGVAAALPLTLARAAGSPLAWTFFQANEAGFRRTPVLLTGKKDAILVDGGFTLADGKTVADAIKATGKRLTTIYISCNDPDYYFSLRPIVTAFPDAKVIAKPATVEAIKANVEAKLKVWGPQLKENGPQTLADVVIPQASDATSLDLEGNAIDIIEVPDMHDRRYLSVPSLEAVFGGVLVDSGNHVWVADTATVALRAAWIKALDGIIARAPKIVVPGHQVEGAPQGLDAVKFTRDYLVAFEEEMGRTKDSAELIAAMTKRYPNLADASSLELGAKVAKGEMKWG